MAIYEDRAGNLWIGTFGSGLGRFRDGKFTSFTSRDGLSDDRVVSIYEDREGDLWVGTYSGGVDRFRDGKVTAYTTKEGLGEDWTYAVYEDRAGSLWIGTKNGLTRFRISGFGFLKASPIRNLQSAIRNQGVRSIYEDRTGNLWIGTQGGGLYRFKDGKFTSYTIKDSQNDVRCIDQDRQGRLWIGGVIGRVGALVRFSEGRLVEYPMKDRISGLVYSILEDRSGHLWVGTNRGLVRLRDEEFTRYTTKDGLSSLNAMSLHEDREGVLWIGTYGGGLNRFKDGKFTSVTMGQGLFDNVVYRILEDDRGNFWMSGNKGIFSVSKKELNDCAEGKVKTITSIAFSTADGMKAIECAGAHQPAGWKTGDGKLWFPTTKGVVMIDPANIPTNMVPPPVYVERVLVDEQAIDLSQQAELPPGREKFEFHYTALSFLDPSRVKFKYLLEGFDKNWVDAGTRRVAYYTNLPPGPHRFRVRACNNDGVWNDAGAAVEFYLKPHFYQTGVFYALSALVLVLLGPSIYLLRVRQLRAREKALERLVDERTRELAELNRTLEQRVREGVKALTEAERMAAYGQLVTGVAHEVRNPLFALQTAAYVIQMQCGQVCQREGVQPQLGVLERETKRLADLMSELLEFARPRSLLLAPTDLKSLLDEAVEMYRAGHDAAFPKIVVGSNSTALQVVVDRGRVVQVLVNLIENAVKHAKGLTTVTLSVDGATGPRACIRVHDDGAGIAPDHLPHIFEPFFTTGKGTGLGLAIVQRIIKEHGGTIEVESEVGRGTVFTICLPISTAEIAENAEI
jgi:signal transduction histidine kinase/streptogramin lyase